MMYCVTLLIANLAKAQTRRGLVSGSAPGDSGLITSLLSLLASLISIERTAGRIDGRIREGRKKDCATKERRIDKWTLAGPKPE